MQFSPETISELRQAKAVVVLTGAGISAESGVPTFRGSEGLWKNYRAEELASPDVFMTNPQLVWEWYNWRKELIAKVEPNPGHYALVELEKLYDQFTIITQNVDNLHFRSGSKKVIEIHGNITKSKCHRCGAMAADKDTHDFAQGLPHCDCGGAIRPAVVWFGESLPEDALQTSFQLSEQSNVFLSVGTSAVVQPAASLPLIAKQHGAFVIEINPEDTPITGAIDVSIRGTSAAVLPQLVTELQQ